MLSQRLKRLALARSQRSALLSLALWGFVATGLTGVIAYAVVVGRYNAGFFLCAAFLVVSGVNVVREVGTVRWWRSPERHVHDRLS